MNFSGVMGFIAGALQFVVAGYAFRLNRRYGTARVSWSLFWAFFLLALLHLVRSLAKFQGVTHLGTGLEVIYALISLLLLTGMIHLDSLLKERLRTEREEQLARANLESEVKKKTAFLTRAIEELQTEIDQRRRVENEFETSFLKRSDVSRNDAMLHIASSIQQSVSDMLKTVNRISIQINQSLEQPPLRDELDSLKTNLEKVASLQQNYAKLAGASPPETFPATPKDDLTPA